MNGPPGAMNGNHPGMTGSLQGMNTAHPGMNGAMGHMAPPDDGLELPILTMTTSDAQSIGAGSPVPGGGGLVRRFDPKTGLPLEDGQPDPDHPDNRVETVLSCPNCQQGFSLKGKIKEVICPRCGKRFEVSQH